MIKEQGEAQYYKGQSTPGAGQCLHDPLHLLEGLGVGRIRTALPRKPVL
jgi:hypothetical protein